LVAKYANSRSCKYLPSPYFKAKAYELIKEECSIIYNLKKIERQFKPLSSSRNTLTNYIGKIRFLQWLAIATRPRE
jgi:hypothetical protein